MGTRIWPFRRKDESGSPRRLSVAGQTDVGRVLAETEDAYEVPWADCSPQGIDAPLIVADGMGGHAAGEVANRMAVDGVVGLITGSDDSPSMEGQKCLEVLGAVL